MSSQVPSLSKGALTERARKSGRSGPTGLAVTAQPTGVGKGSPALMTCVRHRVCGGMIKIVRESSLFILFRVRRTSEETPSEGESPNSHSCCSLLTQRLLQADFFDLLFVASRLFRPTVCCKQTFQRYVNDQG